VGIVIGVVVYVWSTLVVEGQHVSLTAEVEVLAGVGVEAQLGEVSWRRIRTEIITDSIRANIEIC